MSLLDLLKLIPLPRLSSLVPMLMVNDLIRRHHARNLR